MSPLGSPLPLRPYGLDRVVSDHQWFKLLEGISAIRVIQRIIRYATAITLINGSLSIDYGGIWLAAKQRFDELSLNAYCLWQSVGLSLAWRYWPV